MARGFLVSDASAVDDGLRVDKRELIGRNRERRLIAERREGTGEMRGELGDGMVLDSDVRPAIVHITIVLSHGLIVPWRRRAGGVDPKAGAGASVDSLG